ncbi:MAG: NADH-quinone oxidoreductase subunit NuoI [Candidatus Schekmanbacteria bacterium]|nr:NADH-quinone oxidoreductase subunit NuoI [Candidatus Schekmanbacteria bacterium]
MSIKDTARKMIFWDILQGMALTFKYMWTKPITMQYPNERWIPADQFRGQVALVRRPDTPDKDLCVGCCLCVRVCPSNAIRMETSVDENNRKRIDEYNLDVTRCIFCALCVEICPVKALVSTDLFETATYSRQELLRNKETLLKQGHAWRERKEKERAQGIAPQTVVK